MLELMVGLPGGLACASGGRDLDNYLLPIARRLGARRLDAVFGRRGHGRIFGDRVSPGQPDCCLAGSAAVVGAVTGSSESRAWKQQIHDACRAAVRDPPPPGSVALRICFGVSSRRNWSNLWKPAIDALGPVLGIQDLRKPFRPDDDRITDIALHRGIDDTPNHDVLVDVWWSGIATAS